jgi:hypothetical protein
MSHTPLNNVPVFPIFFSPIWVKFDAEDLNGMFSENRHKKDSTFRMSVNGLLFACAEKPYDIWKVKNATINSLHCVTGYSTCNLVKYFTNIHSVVLFTLFICLNTSKVTTWKRVEFSHYSALLKRL